MEWLLVIVVVIALVVYLIVEHQSGKAFERLCAGVVKEINDTKSPK